MARVFNFSAGPAVLPEVVLKQAALEMSEYQDYGMSVMEMSHRSRAYMDIHAEASSLLRKLMNIPDDYAVLFLQGGASLQFSMVPMNIMTSNKKFDIINTGVWTQKAIVEGRKLGQVNVVASSQEEGFSFIPDVDNIGFSHDADYVHICYNNTIYGTKYIKIPDTGNLPLVCDMSSCILSEPYDVSKYGIIFAGAQKNIGPAGVTIVIIKKDLLSRSSDDLATMLNYKVHAESDSLYNTPPTYAIYISMLVFRWLDSLGGVEEIYKLNKEKASLLYDFIDNSSFFKGNVDKRYRSLMNVTFSTPSKDLDSLFVKEAEKHGLVNLAGHKSAGGLRASIYNAMPVEGVRALVDFMKDFELKYSK
ncbi:MAG TPA: 3-phosphoserine/phosphohydroxythreonine transaminase [Spirochaetota bacterium]|nr:3-phosphoserine/phosphohydroxythreonine transaminase [Spirochaetota bacterium]